MTVWPRRTRALPGSLLVALMLSLALPLDAAAQGHLCDDAATRAARDSGVPLSVLLTLTRVETGRSVAGVVEPWPWALNFGGEGAWHDSAADALYAAERAIAQGRRNIDLGCFQINFHWHGHAFSGLAEMLDPDANARYAAQFLTELHAELGDWTATAGAFHSRTEAYAARYLTRFAEIAAQIDTPGEGFARSPRGVIRAPTAVSMAARPPLFSSGTAGALQAASPVRATPARPLWEFR